MPPKRAIGLSTVSAPGKGDEMTEIAPAWTLPELPDVRAITGTAIAAAPVGMTKAFAASDHEAEPLSATTSKVCELSPVVTRVPMGISAGVVDDNREKLTWPTAGVAGSLTTEKSCIQLSRSFPTEVAARVAWRR